MDKLNIINVTKALKIKQINKIIKNFGILPNYLNPNDKLLIIEKNKQMVSLIFYTKHADFIFINFIFTVEKFRMNGLSKKLINHILENEKIKQIDVIILPNSNSDKLFLKLNFYFVNENHMRLKN